MRLVERGEWPADQLKGAMDRGLGRDRELIELPPRPGKEQP